MIHIERVLLWYATDVCDVVLIARDWCLVFAQSAIPSPCADLHTSVLAELLHFDAYNNCLLNFTCSTSIFNAFTTCLAKSRT
jgi:hypothetical protein